MLAKTDEISLSTTFWYNITMKIKDQIKEMDIHLLDLRYRHTRIKNDKILVTLTNSIQAYGQIVPALVVSEQDRYILIDVYKRLAALKDCGHDCITIQIMDTEESASLFLLLAQNNECKLESI